MRDYEADLKVCEAATPGPWKWQGNTSTKSLNLMSCVGWGDIVMGFDRWGMQSAQPVLNENGILKKATEFMAPRATHHPNFDLDLNHPDAQFIAMAREALPKYIQRCIDMRKTTDDALSLMDQAIAKGEALQAENQRLRETLKRAHSDLFALTNNYNCKETCKHFPGCGWDVTKCKGWEWEMDDALKGE